MANSIREAIKLKEEILTYYKGTGYNICDLQKHLKSLSKCIYYTSYDESLLVVQLGNLQVIAGSGDLEFNFIHDF